MTSTQTNATPKIPSNVVVNQDISLHEARFETFVAPYVREECLPLRVKHEHSLKVLEAARQIITVERLEGFLARAITLAALYHDVGRFHQFTRWKTFNDAASENHGILAVGVIKREGFLDDEPLAVRRLVLAAVSMHNRHVLPTGLAPDVRLVTDALRDADKLDIFRVLAQHFNEAIPSGDVLLRVIDEPEHWSPSIVQTVLDGQVPSYTDMHYINDFRILLGSWMPQLTFAASRTLLARSGHMEAVLAGLPQNPELEPVKTCLYGYLEAAKRLGHEDPPMEKPGNQPTMPGDPSDEYRVFAYWYDFLLSPFLNPMHTIISNTCRELHMRHMVDLGCGTGVQCARLLDEGIACLGIDNSPTMLQVARRRMPRDTVFLGDMSVLPYEDDFFDAALLSMVLHAMDADEQRRVLREALRISRHLVLVDYRLPERNLDFAAAWLTRKVEAFTPKRHHQCFKTYMADNAMEGLVQRLRELDKGEVVVRKTVLGGAGTLVVWKRLFAE